jgi:NADPH2:quinone reductase
VNLALLKGCQIVGVFWGDFKRREPENYRQNVSELCALFKAGKLKPLVSREFPLAEYAAALNMFVNRQAVGKIVLRLRS